MANDLLVADGFGCVRDSSVGVLVPRDVASQKVQRYQAARTSGEDQDIPQAIESPQGGDAVSSAEPHSGCFGC